MIKLNNVSFFYDKEINVLKDINLNIEKGKKTVFLGENGSGKSTLFLILNGLLKIKSGEYYFDNKKIEYNKKGLIELRKKIGIIFQDPETQIFAPTVYQELAYGLENIGLSDEQIKNQINKVCTNMEMNDLITRTTHQLSYGQKKRLTIASIVAMEPEVLLLDEPTTWLDCKNTDKVLEWVNYYNKIGKTIIMSTHDMDLAYEVADVVYILDKGQIVKSGEKDEVFTDFELLKKLNLKIPNSLKILQFLNKKGIEITEYEKFLNDNF